MVKTKAPPRQGKKQATLAKDPAGGLATRAKPARRGKQAASTESVDLDEFQPVVQGGEVSKPPASRSKKRVPKKTGKAKNVRAPRRSTAEDPGASSAPAVPPSRAATVIPASDGEDDDDEEDGNRVDEDDVDGDDSRDADFVVRPESSPNPTAEGLPDSDDGMEQPRPRTRQPTPPLPEKEATRKQTRSQTSPEVTRPRTRQSHASQVAEKVAPHTRSQADKDDRNDRPEEARPRTRQHVAPTPEDKAVPTQAESDRTPEAVRPRTRARRSSHGAGPVAGQRPSQEDKDDGRRSASPDLPESVGSSDEEDGRTRRTAASDAVPTEPVRGERTAARVGTPERRAAKSKKRGRDDDVVVVNDDGPRPKRQAIPASKPGDAAGKSPTPDSMILEVLGQLVGSVRTMTERMDKGFGTMAALLQSSTASPSGDDPPAVAKVALKHEIMADKKPARVGKGRQGAGPVNMYTARMDATLCHFDIATSTPCLQMAVAHAVMVEFVHECRGGKHLTADAFMRVLRIMLTAPKKIETPTGKENVTDRIHGFFERVVRRTIRLGEENAFNLFKPSTSPEEDDAQPPQEAKAADSSKSGSAGGELPSSRASSAAAASSSGIDVNGEHPTADAKSEKDPPARYSVLVEGIWIGDVHHQVTRS